MNTRSTMARRDGVAACVLTIAVAALLFTWSPSLRPGFSSPRTVPPTITYYNESSDTLARCDRDPALIALSAAMMLPPVKRGQADAVTPPLNAASSLIRFPDTPPMERYDRIPILIPPRPMTHLAPQRLAAPVAIPTYSVIGTRPPSPAPSPCRMDLIGDWRGRSLDLSPISTLNEPAGPWSFTAVLRYDRTGQIQHALLESVALDQTMRDEIARRLYQCRVTPGDSSGEGRVTVSGPGHR